jgi:WD40 repeat protein
MRLGYYLKNLPALIHVLKHDQPVNTAEFSPDGKRVVTATGAAYSREGSTGSARVWDALTGDPITGELRHEGAVYSASFSPDGLRVVTAGGDETARVWDAATGAELLSLPHNNVVRRVYYSPDGGRILTASNKARVWDALTGKLLASSEESDWNIWYASFSPNGDRVIAVTANPFMDGGSTALLWDPLADSVMTLSLGGYWGYDGSFSPDGTKVVTAGMAGVAQIWSVASGEPIGAELQHKDRVAHASFSPDGKLVLTAGWDGTARLWLAETGEPLTTESYKPEDRIPRVFHHGGQIKYASFSPDGRLVATASTDGFVRIWDVKRGKEFTASLPFSHFRYPAGTGGWVGDKSPGAEFYIDFSPDSRRIVTAGWDGTARIWDLTPSGLAVGPSKVEPALESDSQFLTVHKVIGFLNASAPKIVKLNTKEATVNILDPLTMRPIGTPPNLDKPAGEAVLSPDGKHLATIGAVAGKIARVWDVETGKAIGARLEHDHYLAYAGGKHLVFSPNGNRLATISNGNNPQVGIVRLWDMDSGELVFPPLQHGSWASGIAFDRDGKRLATAWSAVVLGNNVEGGVARIWNAETGLPNVPELRHRLTVNGVWFTPDDRYLVTLEGSDNTYINIWDAATGKLETKIVHSAGGVTDIVFSSDGLYFATASNTQAARVWELASGKALTPWLRHIGNGKPSIFMPSGLTSIAFSPDGIRLVTGSVDKTFRIWEVQSGLPLTPFIEYEEPIQDLSFSPDGRQVLVLGSGGLFSAWNFTPEYRPIEELVRLTQILGVRRLDETGSLVKIDLKAFLELWAGHIGQD